MSSPDIGDESEIRLTHFHQFLYVSRMTGPHFHYCNLCIGRNGKHCQRHTYVIVEIALCRSRAVFCGKYGIYQLLGRGLAIGASKTDERNRQTPAIIQCKLPQRH